MTTTLHVTKMNGGWTFLLKVVLILIPLQVAFQAWTLSQIIELREFRAVTETILAALK